MVTWCSGGNAAAQPWTVALQPRRSLHGESASATPRLPPGWPFYYSRFARNDAAPPASAVRGVATVESQWLWPQPHAAASAPRAFAASRSTSIARFAACTAPPGLLLAAHAVHLYVPVPPSMARCRAQHKCYAAAPRLCACCRWAGHAATCVRGRGLGYSIA